MLSWRVWCKNTYSESPAGKLQLLPTTAGAGMVTDRSGLCAASLGVPATLLYATINSKGNSPSSPIVFTTPPFTALCLIVNRHAIAAPGFSCAYEVSFVAVMILLVNRSFCTLSHIRHMASPLILIAVLFHSCWGHEEYFIQESIT